MKLFLGIIHYLFSLKNRVGRMMAFGRRDVNLLKPPTVALEYECHTPTGWTDLTSSLSATRLRRNPQLRPSRKKGFQTKTLRRLKKSLLVQKVVDKMGENRGAGQIGSPEHIL